MSLAHQYDNVLALEFKHSLVQGAYQQACTDNQSLRDEWKAMRAELAELEEWFVVHGHLDKKWRKDWEL